MKKQRSWYGDSLRAGRSAVQTPVGARFSERIQTGPEAYLDSCSMGTVPLSGEKQARMAFVIYLLLPPRLNVGRAIPVHSFNASLACCGRVFTYAFIRYRHETYVYTYSYVRKYIHG
jgi:hypothetical protein